MSKLKPEQKWDNIVLTRLGALKISAEFKILRKAALVSLGMEKRFSNVGAWSKDFPRRSTSSSYQEWLFGECQPVADRYGINPQVVSMLCLIKRFDPEKHFQPFAIEAITAKVNVVTDSTDPEIINRLAYESYSKLGIPLIQIAQSGEIRRTVVDTSNPNQPPVISSNKLNSILSLFRLRIELPSGCPPDFAQAITSFAITKDRQLRESLGFKVPKRIRTSKYIKQADKYKLSKKTLRQNEAYDIIDKIYGGEDQSGKDMELDKQRRVKANVIRHRLKKAFSNLV